MGGLGGVERAPALGCAESCLSERHRRASPREASSLLGLASGSHYWVMGVPLGQRPLLELVSSSLLITASIQACLRETKVFKNTCIIRKTWSWLSPSSQFRLKPSSLGKIAPSVHTCERFPVVWLGVVMGHWAFGTRVSITVFLCLLPLPGNKQLVVLLRSLMPQAVVD